MRSPTVENKYNLTPALVTKLRINRDKINANYFWRNNVIGAWCISGSTAKTAADRVFSAYSSFWLGVYDEDAKDLPCQIQLNFYAYGDMCNYIFNSFYDFSTIEHEIDLQIQEKFLEKINYLIDEGVFSL